MQPLLRFKGINQINKSNAGEERKSEGTNTFRITVLLSIRSIYMQDLYVYYEVALEHFVSRETIRSFQNCASYIAIFPRIFTRYQFHKL